jgi:hypothetical protein
LNIRQASSAAVSRFITAGPVIDSAGLMDLIAAAA